MMRTMQLLQGRDFLTGCDDGYPAEAPARRVNVPSGSM